jgi:hypothetical protein
MALTNENLVDEADAVADGVASAAANKSRSGRKSRLETKSAVDVAGSSRLGAIAEAAE